MSVHHARGRYRATEWGSLADQAGRWTLDAHGQKVYVTRSVRAWPHGKISGEVVAVNGVTLGVRWANGRTTWPDAATVVLTDGPRR